MNKMSMVIDNLPQLPLNYLNVLSFCTGIKNDISSYHLAPDVIRNIIFANKGWKLSKVGLKLISKNFKPYTSKHDNNKIVTGKILLKMDDCCNSPWSLFDGVVTVFDPILHFELQMVDGDISAFIDFKSPVD